ncbi:hypothetical protein ACC853_38340, partial [Rhizobium johnstonii]
NPNVYGVIPDYIAAAADPHPDSVKVGDAVRAMQEFGLRSISVPSAATSLIMIQAALKPCPVSAIGAQTLQSSCE